MRTQFLTVATLMFAMASTGHAATSNITFRKPPATEEEKAVARVLEAFAAKAGRDGAGAAELFTEDGVVHWVAGEFNERQIYEGRDRISVLFTSAALEKAEYTGITIRVTADRAEAAGQSVLIFRAYRCNVTDNPADCRWLRRSQRVWKLRREREGWRISSDVTTQSVLIMR